MNHTLHGKHLIAGQWIGSSHTFSNSPAFGEAHYSSIGTPDLVNQACQAAERAFCTYGSSSRAERAQFLRCIADEIEARAGVITQTAHAETALPEARLHGERARTAGQLRLFADTIEQGAYLDRRHDAALPKRQPLPRPDLRLMQRPIGPVAVFGASNFPLAFSAAGGDTAAALAAGCPVVVKGHEGHPGTSEIVADAIAAAIAKCSIDAGVFSLIQGGSHDVGQALVQHPHIQAVGFTGSLAGGRALFDLCAQRPQPIPFFGELGAVNPIFHLPAIMAEKAAVLGEGWAGSLTMGVGQFCTNPGIAVVIAGSDADAFADAAKTALAKVSAQTMLTAGIADAYAKGSRAVGSAKGVETLLAADAAPRCAAPALYRVSAADWLADRHLQEEVFGPLGIIVTAGSAEQLPEIAQAFAGQLTATLQMADADLALAKRLLPILERKAGRVMVNGYPTGVEVCDAMVHGGPYPASTNFGATSVGTLSIRRFLRPVCYQDFPEALLPADLHR